LLAGLPDGFTDGLVDGDPLGLAEGLGDGEAGAFFSFGVHAPKVAAPATKTIQNPRSQIQNRLCLLIVFPLNKLPRGSFSAGWQPAGPAALVSRNEYHALNIMVQTTRNE
jgi:hypothetical protein